MMTFYCPSRHTLARLFFFKPQDVLLHFLQTYMHTDTSPSSVLLPLSLPRQLISSSVLTLAFMESLLVDIPPSSLHAAGSRGADMSRKQKKKKNGPDHVEVQHGMYQSPPMLPSFHVRAQRTVT